MAGVDALVKARKVFQVRKDIAAKALADANAKVAAAEEAIRRCRLLISQTDGERASHEVAAIGRRLEFLREQQSAAESICKSLVAEMEKRRAAFLEASRLEESVAALLDQRERESRQREERRRHVALLDRLVMETQGASGSDE